MTARKHRDAPLEAHVRIRYPSKKRLDEFVHALTGLARQSGESLLQYGIDGDGGVRHTYHCATTRDVPLRQCGTLVGVQDDERPNGRERRELLPGASKMPPKLRSNRKDCRGVPKTR